MIFKIYVIALKLMDGIVLSSLPNGRRVSYLRMENVMDVHGKRLLGDSSFVHPGRMLKWMDLRNSPILHTLFGRVIFNS